jgi:hypothetical protein
MGVEQRLDLRRARASFEARDDATVPDEHESGRFANAKPLRELGLFVDVDPNHVHAMALLSRDLVEDALHSAARPRSNTGEEQEQRLLRAAHEDDFPGPGDRQTASRLDRMWEAYRIGVAAGIGAAAVLFVAAWLAGTRVGLIATAVVGAAVGVAVGFLLDDWTEAVAGAVGALLGAAASVQIVRGTLRRGGTTGGTAILVAVAAVAVAALAFVPALGYVEALTLPALAARLRRTAPERYAGLRTLARD